jgi:uncharacterized protein YbjT (DUF2867 family)
MTNYKKAIESSGVKKVIYLSSIGGHTDQGNGMLRFHYDAEHILGTLPAEVNIKFLRAVGFYSNLFGFIPMIKSQGAIIANYGGDEKNPWAAAEDIADAIAEELEKPFQGREVVYVASDEVSPNEIRKSAGRRYGTRITVDRSIR